MLMKKTFQLLFEIICSGSSKTKEIVRQICSEMKTVHYDTALTENKTEEFAIVK